MVTFGSPIAKRHVIKRTACNPYISPAAGASINSSAPLTLAWNKTCFTDNPTAIDIFLYAPYTTNPKIHVFQDVNFALGQYDVTLMPRWWNATAQVQLQYSIHEHGSPFAGQFGPSPLFTANYAAPANGTADPSADSSTHDSGFTEVKNFLKSLSKGDIAAAVVVPVLLLLALGVAWYVRRARAGVAEKRKRFSVAVDRRMSTISNNWQSISAAGASAAIRNSMATYGRPSGEAGSTVGTGPRPAMSSRSGGGGTRVSFAADSFYARQSLNVSSASVGGDARASRYADAPPLPVLGALSPKQAAGAHALSPDDIRARIDGHPYAPYAGDDDVAPALSMMRAMGGTDTLLFAPGSPNPSASSPMPSSAGFPPTPTPGMPLPPVPAATSPLGPMPFLGGAAIHPDAAFRSYAAGVSPTGPTFPPIAAARTVYSPHTQTEPNPFRRSSVYPDEDDESIGTAS